MSRYSFSKKVSMVSVFILAMTLAAFAQSTFSTMVHFNGYNGEFPTASMIQANDGNFYGTTYYGGKDGYGTVYQLTPYGVPRYNQSVIYSFKSHSDGANPYGSLLQGSDGNLYGTAYDGGEGVCGSVGCGTLFSINFSGNTHTATAVHTFSTVGNDGINPIGAVIQDPTSHVLFGVASNGGANGFGMIYSVNPDGSGYTDLYDFCPVAGCADGEFPVAGLIEDASGNLYGTTPSGGANNDGVVFELVNGPPYAYTKLFDFTGIGGAQPGAFPEAALVFGPDGNLYGTTEEGGVVTNFGTVFEVNIDRLPDQFTSNYSFAGGNDGAFPVAPLVLASDGYFYGTTEDGGVSDLGTVFRFSNFTGHSNVTSFAGSPNGGAYPIAGLVEASNGYLYGTTLEGGHFDDGEAYTISPAREQFVPVTPCRLEDTRTTGTPLQATGTTNFNIRKLALDQCGYDLSAASSYALNVTIVPTNGPVGFLTIWPANSPCLEGWTTTNDSNGVCRPNTSTFNSYDGNIKAAFPIVEAGWDTGTFKPASAISVYNSSSVASDFIIDIQGYYTEQQALQFYAMQTPGQSCRVVDTRRSNGPLGGPSLVGNMPRQFPMMTSSCFSALNGVPPYAYALNLTVVPSDGEALSYLTAWPGGTTQPNVSNLNNLQMTAVANAAIVAAGPGADGPVLVYASNDTDFVIDVVGYYNPPSAQGVNYYPGVPCRSVDTRSVTAGAGFTGTYEANIGGSDCTPFILLTPTLYDVNATAVSYGDAGYLTLWPVGEPQPFVSTLNVYNGPVVTSNSAIVGNLNNVGVINGSIFGPSPSDLLLDVNGYFAPTAPGGGGGGNRWRRWR